MTRDSTRLPGRALSSLAAVSALASLSVLMGALPAAQAASANLTPHPAAQAASAVPTDIHARPVYGPLQAGQIAQIQSLGRSVLIAKHDQLPSAQEQALVEELHALSNDIDQAILPKQGKIELLANTGSPASRIAAQADALRNTLQPHLTRLHERRTTLEAYVPTEPEARQAHLARMKYLSGQVAEIERSVQTALALPDDERHARLVALSQQLKPRSQDQWVREQRRIDVAEHPAGAASAIDLDKPTPTVTTLIAHRPGPSARAAQR